MKGTVSEHSGTKWYWVLIRIFATMVNIICSELEKKDVHGLLL